MVRYGAGGLFADRFQIVGSARRATWLGGNILIWTEKVGVLLQGEFNVVSMDTQGVPGASSTLKFYTIRAGLNFHVMPK